MDNPRSLILAASLMLALTACNDLATTGAIVAPNDNRNAATGGNSDLSTADDTSLPPTVGNIGITAKTINKSTRTLAFQPVTDNTNLQTVKWDFGDGQTASDTNPIHSYARDGIYDVTLTAVHSSGKKASTSTSVTANAAPVAAFSGKVLSAMQLQLDASASSDKQGTINTYVWTLGDGSEKRGKTLTHRYTAAGTYAVTLTVTDELGDSATTTQKFKIAAAPTKIVLIGDSITQARYNTVGFRYELWKKLIKQGYSFDLVGSMTNNYKGNPKWPTVDGNRFDQDHEGHAGWRADQVARDLDKWLRGYDVDIALIHIGTNDLLQNEGTVTQTASEISQIIGKLRRKNSRVTILLSNLIPYRGANYKLDQLNTKIRALATQLNSPTSRIVFVDQNTGYYVSDNYDGIHPKSPVGENKIATKYFNALQPFL